MTRSGGGPSGATEPDEGAAVIGIRHEMSRGLLPRSSSYFGGIDLDPGQGRLHAAGRLGWLGRHTCRLIFPEELGDGAQALVDSIKRPHAEWCVGGSRARMPPNTT